MTRRHVSLRVPRGILKIKKPNLNLKNQSGFISLFLLPHPIQRPTPLFCFPSLLRLCCLPDDPLPLFSPRSAPNISPPTPQSASPSSPRSSKSLKLLHNLLTDFTVPQISLMTLNSLKSPFLSSFRPKTGQPMSQILTKIVAIVASRIFSGSDQLWEELIDYVYVSITDFNVTQEVQEMGFRIQGSNVSLTHFLSLKRNPNFLSPNIFSAFSLLDLCGFGPSMV